jgi:hypothetical protein
LVLSFLTAVPLGKSNRFMHSNEHLPLERLWDYHSANVTLDTFEMDHLYECVKCAAALGVCIRSKSLEAAREDITLYPP